MERPEENTEQTSTEGTGDETAHVANEESPTVMPEQDAENERRDPAPPPPGSGPDGG